MRVLVVDLIQGVDALTQDDGRAVYDAIHPALLAGESVELDFAGVQASAGPFFNVALGQLLADLSAETLRAKLTLPNLQPHAGNVARMCIAGAKRYYADPVAGDAFNRELDTLL